MKTNLYSLFDTKKETTYSETVLISKIFAAIEKSKKSEEYKQKILWSISSAVFLIATIATGWHAISSLISSDTGSYISLIFSDTSSALSIWKELSISIVESLPIIGIGLFLASIYLLFWSAKKYAFRSSHNLAY